jgi:hypothetical protein
MDSGMRKLSELFTRYRLKKRMVYLFLQFLVLHGSQTRAETKLLDDAQLQSRMLEVHDLIWERFVHPETQLIYDYVAPLTEKNRWNHLPTDSEIKASLPNVAGWNAGMEDSALNGGAYMAAMIEAFELTKDPKYAEKARRLYLGLKSLAEISPRKGFVPRGYAPGGQAVYVNSSVDQYTLYVYGLWAYYRSSISTSEERRVIAGIVRDICDRIVSDDFQIMTAEGKPALYCNIGALASERASRLLEVLRVGADITGDSRLLELHNTKMKEANWSRLHLIVTPSMVSKTPSGTRTPVYGIYQNQVSLIPLLQLEGSLSVKAVYLEAMRVNARLAEDSLDAFRQYTPSIHKEDYTLGAWRNDRTKSGRPPSLEAEYPVVRVPCEAMCIILLAADKFLVEPQSAQVDKMYRKWLERECRELLSSYEFSRMRTYALIYAEIAYWQSVRIGLFRHNSTN